ncbi:MAG: RsmE family RNA methyltransferase [Chitinispirillales bacterium]|jgi:16S rRNA (uracil1498-N3)-methyltransferase|nr:RsmE family RNA methyltransferase [Chitinispirillales bacterium]
MKNIDHHLFYSDNITDDTVFLNDSETNHAISVLRIKIGQQIQITNGKGTIYDCLCVDITRQSLSCRIINKTTIPKITPELTLLAGLPDKDPFETILEHTTAIGVSRVIPLIMDHCRKPWWSSWEKSYERFKAKMIVSMKQCLYPYLPKLDAPLSLQEVIDMYENPIIVADQHGKPLHNADLPAHSAIICLVGPPGGISANEHKLLKDRNSLFVKIAPTRLKTELAATVLCSRILYC